VLGSQAPALQLGSDTVTASDHVRVIGVTFSSDLSLQKHVSKTCAASFHWLRQLRRIRKSLDDGSAATVVHAFVTSRVDYCNAVYAEAPKTVTDNCNECLMLPRPTRVVSDTRKFDRGLTSLLHDELHWLDVPERVTYKMGVMVYRSLHGQAPRYLADHFITSSGRRSLLRLRSANRHQLIVPRCRLNTYDRRAFSIAGPTVWNSLPDELRDPACGSNSFKQFLKTILFSINFTTVTSALQVFTARCTLVQSAVLRSSVCPSVTLVNW